MSLRFRFLLSLVAVLGIMAVAAVFGVTRVATVRDIALDLRRQVATSALSLGRLRTALEQLDRYQRLYVATTEAEYSDLMWQRLEDARVELDALRRGGYADVVAATDVPLDSLADVTARLGALVSADLLTAATAYREIAAAPLISRAADAVPALAEAIDQHTARSAEVAVANADAATTAATTAMLVALVLSAALAIAAAGLLTGPLERLRYAMARVADGAFEAPEDLPYDRPDELGELSRSFRAMTLRLAQLDRMKAEFIGIASHELKTPIGVISGYTELIRDEFAPRVGTRERQLLDALTEQADVLRRRLDQLLEISRMEAGALELGMEEIYLPHFASGFEREFGRVATAGGIDFSVRLDERAPPFLLADPDVLRVDVFANVIGNALKFTPPGGTVDVAIRADGDDVVFDITDSGPGIPAEQVDRVFEKYWQGRDARGGSGLGLAIAKAAVEAHDGRIDVHSRPGRGARFRIVLPAGSRQDDPLGEKPASDPTLAGDRTASTRASAS